MWYRRLALPVTVLCTLLLSVSSCVDKDKKGLEGIQTLTIVCLGDSITHGHKLVNPDLESYPSRLRQRARGRWQVLNLGVNGATVLGEGDVPIVQQAAFSQTMGVHPDVIVVMLGTNDTKNKNWPHIEDFENDYRQLITKLQSQASRPHLIICSIPPILIDYPNGLTEKRQKQINTLVKKVAARTGADFLDIYAGMADMPSMFIDGVHPNALGAKKIASLVFARISSL